MKHTAKHIVGYRYNDDGLPKEKSYKGSTTPKKTIKKIFMQPKSRQKEISIYVEIRITSKYNYIEFVEYYKKGGIPIYTIDPNKIGGLNFKPYEFVARDRHISGNKYYVLSVPKYLWQESDNKLKLLSKLYPIRKYRSLYKFEYPKLIAEDFRGIE